MVNQMSNGVVKVVCQVLVCLMMMVSSSVVPHTPSTIVSISPSFLSSNQTNPSRPLCHPVPSSVLRLRFTETFPLSRKFGRKRRRKGGRSRREADDFDQFLLEMRDRLSLSMITGEQHDRHHKRHLTDADNNHKNSNNNNSNNASNIEQFVSGLDNPPWHCDMKSRWKRMKKGIYPRHVETGRCRQKKCFFDMYECSPRKYVIWVLKKSKKKCRPVPKSNSDQTHYEEVWNWSKLKVTVGCDCVRRHGVVKGNLKAMLGL